MFLNPSTFPRTQLPVCRYRHEAFPSGMPWIFTHLFTVPEPSEERRRGIVNRGALRKPHQVTDCGINSRGKAYFIFSNNHNCFVWIFLSTTESYPQYGRYSWWMRWKEWVTKRGKGLARWNVYPTLLAVNRLSLPPEKLPFCHSSAQKHPPLINTTPTSSRQ